MGVIAEPPEAASHTPGRTRRASWWRYVLFDPTSFFAAAGRFLAPVRGLAILLWPLAAVAVLALVKNSGELIADTKAVFSSFRILPHLFISMFTSNLLSKLMQGTVIVYMGGNVDSFGIRLRFGVYPRFFIPLESVRRLPFRAQRVCYAAGLKTRLALFAVGMLLWLMLRPSGSGAAYAALVFGAVGLGAFLFSLNPLWPADGYRWMSAWLEQPRLRENGLRIIGRLLAGRPMPASLGTGRKWALFVYALASVAYMTAFILLVVVGVAVGLEERYSGTGVFLFSILLGLMVLYLISKLRGRATRQAEAEDRRGSRALRHGAEPSVRGVAAVGREGDDAMSSTSGLGTPTEPQALSTARARRQARTREAIGTAPPTRLAPNIEALLDPKRQRRSLLSRWKTLLVWAALIAGAVYVAMLPYPFQVGGEFVIQPVSRAEVRARTAGEIVQVLVQEGDWVAEGQVLARLSSWNEERDVAVLEAEISRGEAELATLVAPPRREEITVAEQRIETATVHVEATERELQRQRELFAIDVGSGKLVDQAEDRHRIALAEREEAHAQLELLGAPALASQVAAAEASILRDERDLTYRRIQLEHTEIKATADGRIVTPLEELRVGAFLPVGGLFAQIENSATVLAEIEVPETDIPEVALGASSELRLWSSPNEAVYGEVRRISPRAEERDFGRVVRVLVEVRNPDGRLTTNMTGYGKIEAEERPVWQAFTRMFVRFTLIELWSWIP